jgi:hypothetical protein
MKSFRITVPNGYKDHALLGEIFEYIEDFGKIISFSASYCQDAAVITIELEVDATPLASMVRYRYEVSVELL